MGYSKRLPIRAAGNLWTMLASLTGVSVLACGGSLDDAGTWDEAAVDRSQELSLLPGTDFDAPDAPLGPRRPPVFTIGEPIQMCVDGELMPDEALPPLASPQLPPAPPGTDHPGVNRAPLTAEAAKMWEPGRTLRVRFVGGSATVRTAVRTHAERWTEFANIHFDFVSDSASADLVVSFSPGGSWSRVGRDALVNPFQIPTMNFGWFNDDTPDEEFRRVVLHEFGHALGLVHEQQSPAAGIPWDTEKVYAWCRDSQGWDAPTCEDNVLFRYSATSTNYSTYDPTSIMHYPISPALTLDHRGTPWNTDLSETDRAYIRSWYPFPQDATGTLHTGECDDIGFRVEYDVLPPDQVGFALVAGANVTCRAPARVRGPRAARAGAAARHGAARLAPSAGAAERAAGSAGRGSRGTRAARRPSRSECASSYSAGGAARRAGGRQLHHGLPTRGQGGSTAVARRSAGHIPRAGSPSRARPAPPLHGQRLSSRTPAGAACRG